MFVVVPTLPFLVAWTLWGDPYWWLVVISGILLYFPVHQLGPAIGYHKLFVHRSFDPRPWYPYLSAFIGSIAFFGDPMNAAMVHRNHHRYADTDKDPHSPIHGRFHAYLGWIATYKPSLRDSIVVTDLARDYPWLVIYRKHEWMVPLIFHSVLYILSPIIFSAVAIACLLSVHNGLAINAFSHDPHNQDNEKAIDSIFLGRWINPAFLHRHHHQESNLYDYSHSGVKDHWATFIEKFLSKPKSI